MRLLSIVAGVLFFTISAFFYLRFSGLQRTYEPFEHAFFPAGRVLNLLELSSQSSPVSELKNVLSLAEKKTHGPLLGLLVETLYRPDEGWFWKMGDHLSRLQDLSEFTQTPILFALEDYKKIEATQFRDAIKGLNLKVPFAISSPADPLLLKLRELEPLWIFGGGQGELTRLTTMTSLWVEPSLNIKSDFFIFPYRWRGVQLYESRSLQELQRRHKKFLMGPVTNQKELDEVMAFKPDGVILSDLHLFIDTAPSK